MFSLTESFQKTEESKIQMSQYLAGLSPVAIIINTINTRLRGFRVRISLEPGVSLRSGLSFPSINADWGLAGSAGESDIYWGAREARATTFNAKFNFCLIPPGKFPVSTLGFEIFPVRSKHNDAAGQGNRFGGFWRLCIKREELCDGALQYFYVHSLFWPEQDVLFYRLINMNKYTVFLGFHSGTKQWTVSNNKDAFTWNWT